MVTMRLSQNDTVQIRSMRSTNAGTVLAQASSSQFISTKIGQ